MNLAWTKRLFFKTSGMWGYSINTACQQNDKIVCWVSRPWEKGIFVLYMAFWALMGIFLTFVELCYFLTHTAYKVRICYWIYQTHTLSLSLKGFKRKKQRRRQKYALIRTTKLDDTNSGHYNPYKTAEFRERLNKNRNQNSQLHRRNHTGSQNNLQRQERGSKVKIVKLTVLNQINDLENKPNRKEHF